MFRFLVLLQLCQHTRNIFTLVASVSHPLVLKLFMPLQLRQLTRRVVAEITRIPNSFMFELFVPLETGPIAGLIIYS